ncbi:EH domain-containing protein 2-like isoform X2 [Phoenix dactylifera]|uniref:EH domain-containing protein 2-like isoform X2 n=1 Tax=Phoenix dactylifera TaxID=42345 RepID=A0A8B7MTQ7_PHODC|nr:EH domain-containing protein 2-like isoform X2 [Phoenix dactylifera]
MGIVSSPISTCSRKHQKIYQEWFFLADSDGEGRITGNDAIEFFAMSKLSRPELQQMHNCVVCKVYKKENEPGSDT